MSDVRPITQNFARPSYRPPQPAGMDPEIRRMALVAAGFGGVLALAVGAFHFGGQGRPHSVPVIAPPSTPVRVKPDQPGGMQVAGADDFAVQGAEALAPPPEKPAISALRAKKAEHDAPHETAVAPANAAAPIVSVAPAPAVALNDADAGPGGAGVSVQFAAFENAQAAGQEWGRLAGRMPDYFNGHAPSVQRARLAGRTVYRLSTGGFPTRALAAAFCAEVRAQGGDCSIPNP